jgi:glucosamine-6-phosphate deaminase
MKIIVADSYQDMSRKAANIISAEIILYPRCVIGLATGSTMIGIYRQLIEWYNKGDLDFSEISTINWMNMPVSRQIILRASTGL